MSSKLPLPSFKRETKNSSTPSKLEDQKCKSPSRITSSTNKKYAHIQSKVKTFWTPVEMQKAGVQKFFNRKGASSASTSASSSATNSPGNNNANRSMMSLRHTLQYKLSGPDFAARLNELRSGIKDNSMTEETAVEHPMASSSPKN